MVSGLSSTITQDEFGRLVGVSQQRVAAMVAEGVLTSTGTAGHWLLAYCERLREQAAGRGQELTIQRAGLAREQRIGQEIKNRVAQKEYAPIGLLADVLAAASRNVVDRFDALSGTLARTCPGLDDEARTQVLRVIASARNEWVRSTESLAVAALDDLVMEDEDAEESVEEGPPPDEDYDPQPA